MKIRLKSLFRGPFTNYDDKQVGGVGLQNVNVENKRKNKLVNAVDRGGCPIFSNCVAIWLRGYVQTTCTKFGVI